MRLELEPLYAAFGESDDWRARYRNFIAGFEEEPTPGLEPGTPSLRVKCSTS
jgi:hypothetical protein